MNKRIVSFFFLLLFTGAIYAAIDITDLRTELLKSPEGIDVRQPRLSWRIESDEQNVIQTAYHILVASSPELLEQGKGDIWDSGKIESDASQWITYQGRSEEHTSELQSPCNLVCRLLLEKNFFNDTATTEIYTLSLHDALPISHHRTPSS